ncbi:MAG: ankyrin repeat domain-containing protein [Armatimonadetes bacterium]|nr:ankyrin repeat domain-containing protein [Armatimonadota bacterium]
MSDESGWDDFLGEAIDLGDMDMIREALAHGADPNAMTGGDAMPRTAFYWAVAGQDMEVVRLLLESGARVAAEREADDTSLHRAVNDNYLPLIEMLLAADGAAALNWFDYIDRTPLMVAVQNGNIEIARRLIAAGADVNARNVVRLGNTALHVVAANGQPDMAKLLVEAGADPLAPGWMGITPLDKARKRKRAEGRQVCELLKRAAGFPTVQVQYQRNNTQEDSHP